MENLSEEELVSVGEVRLNYDDTTEESVDKISGALSQVAGICLVDDGERHEGYVVYRIAVSLESLVARFGLGEACLEAMRRVRTGVSAGRRILVGGAGKEG